MLKTKQLIILLATALIVFIAVKIFYIPMIIKDNSIKNIVKHSKEDVKRLQLVREYYVKSVVGDIKKYAPNIKFDFEHAGKDSKLPFPTTVVHDLTKLYSQRSEIKFALYSNYPFLNRKDRVLSDFQKEALDEVKKSEDGVYYKEDTVNGKKVLRVAVADYMVLPACVNCHNSHKLKTWSSDKWKLGDVRGVVEVITPLN